jgi:hypothetical protein
VGSCHFFKELAGTVSPWQDTHLTIHAGESVILGLSYIYLGLHLQNQDDPVGSAAVHVAMIRIGSGGASFIYV